MFGDDQDYKFQMDLHSANHMDTTPEAPVEDLAVNASSNYDTRNGFSDVDLLSSLKGFTEEIPVINNEDSVAEFIAQSEGQIQFNSHGDPHLIQHANDDSPDLKESLPTSLETSPQETLAMFDQEDS